MVEFSPRYAEICPQGYPSEERTQWLIAPWGPDRKPVVVKSFHATNFASMMIAEANSKKATAKDEGREYTDEQNAMLDGFVTMAEILSSTHPVIKAGDNGGKPVTAIDLLNTDPSGTKLLETVISSFEIPSDQTVGLKAAIYRFTEVRDLFNFDPVI
jgi:hypothetical protein